MNKYLFKVILAMVSLVLVYLIIPHGVDPKDVANGYNDLSENNTGKAASFERGAFITYKKTTIEEEAENGVLSNSTDFPRYLQGDYSTVKINDNISGTISSSGCGYTCYAMIVSWVTGKQITPDKFVKTEIPSKGATIGDGYDGNGIDQDYTADAVEEIWGIKSSVKYTNSAEILEIVKKELNDGKLVMVGVNNRPWTNNMHRIIIRKWLDKSKSLVQVVDPNARSNARVLGMGLDEFYEHGWKIPDQFGWYAVVTFEFPE